MSRAMAAVLVVLGAIAALANGALYTVQQTEQVIVTSRSVAVSERRRSPASRRTLDRIGSVDRDPTMF